MATHRRKVIDVEARQFEGPGTLNVYHKVKGDQSAKKGDWLVGPENAQHGDIEVVKKEDFERDYKPIEESRTEDFERDVYEHGKADATPVIGNAEGSPYTTEEQE